MGTFKVNSTALININLVDHVSELVLRGRLAKRAHNVAKLGRCDRAAVVFVLPPSA